VRRTKGQPIWPIQINCELAGKVAGQLVTSTWQATHCLEVRGSSEVIQPPANEFRSLNVVLSDEALELVAVLLEIVAFKLYVHGAPWTYMLTLRVNEKQALLGQDWVAGGPSDGSSGRKKNRTPLSG